MSHELSSHSSGLRRLTVETFEPRLPLTATALVNHQVEPLAMNLGSPEASNLAANPYGFTGVGQTVVIIDSGIAHDHAALGGFGTSRHIVAGWDFAENDADAYDDGPMGSHGTHVAGILGSRDSRHPGIAPGADLVALRVFDDQGQGNFERIEAALQWVEANRTALANPITTINLSIGSRWNADGAPDWSIIEDELARLAAEGVFISVAAGNSFQQYGAAGLSYPAASSHVVPVGSVDASGNISAFSQRSDRALFAPGERITSAVPDYAGNFNYRADDFLSLTGTSMAAPQVAGASVLVREAFATAGRQHITHEDIYAVLRETAGEVYDPVTGHHYRVLDLPAALEAVMATRPAPPLPPTPPVIAPPITTPPETTPRITAPPITAPPVTTPPATGPASISQDGSAVYIHGTEGDDTFSFRAATGDRAAHEIIVNGTAYHFASGQPTRFYFLGGGGRDAIEMVGGQRSDDAALRAGKASLRGPDYLVIARNVEDVTIDGGRGGGRAYFVPTGAEDSLSSAAGRTRLSGRNHLLTAVAFDTIRSRSLRRGGPAGSGSVDVSAFQVVAASVQPPAALADQFYEVGGRSATYALGRRGASPAASPLDAVHDEGGRIEPAAIKADAAWRRIRGDL